MEFDLYGDLDLAPTLVTAPAEAPCQVPIRLEKMSRPDGALPTDPRKAARAPAPTIQSQAPSVPLSEFKLEDDVPDGEDVKALLTELLTVAASENAEETEVQVDDTAFLLTEEPPPAAPVKKRRTEAAPAPAAENDFDFEADMPDAPEPDPQRGEVQWQPEAEEPQSAKSNEYRFNRRTGRWEQGFEMPVPESKIAICRFFLRGFCKYRDRCRDAHGEAELKGVGAENLRRRCVAQCILMARNDAKQEVCSYPQALVVRLALRCEERLQVDLLDCVAKAGLPMSNDKRTTVRALLRLCHPDKCKHPEAKKAVQILSPLLSS